MNAIFLLNQRMMLYHICKAIYLSDVSQCGSPKQQNRICRLYLLLSVKMRYSDATLRHHNCFRLLMRKTREINACIPCVSVRSVSPYIQHTKVRKILGANQPKSAQCLLRYHQVRLPKFLLSVHKRNLDKNCEISGFRREVVRQIPGYKSPRRGAASTLPNELCCSVYCLCVNVYCTTATGCQPNCS